MATNLIALIGQFLTPELIGRIASALGVDQSLVQKAIGASVPGLLAGLAGVAAQPKGARQLSDMLAQQSPGTLDSVIGMIGGARQKGLAENGAAVLSSLLGGNATNALSAAVGKFAGISEGTSKSLLGVVGPVVMSVLAGQQRSAGLDGNGPRHFLHRRKIKSPPRCPPALPSSWKGRGSWTH